MSVEKYTTKAGTRWRVRYTRPDGTRSDKRGFLTKAEARTWEASIVSGKTSTPLRHEPPLSHYREDYLLTLKGYSPSTVTGRTIALRRHVLPQWGHRRASTLTHAEIQRWIDRMDLARPTLLGILATLRGLLDVALPDQTDKVRPADNIRVPTYIGRRPSFLTFPQLKLLAENSRHPDVILTLGLVGLRWGELSALEAGDYDPNTRRLTIERSVERREREWIVGPTKTRKIRVVSVPAVVAELLEERTKGREPGAIIFPGPTGEYMFRPNGRDSWFRAAVAACRAVDPGFPAALRPHDLRHTAASLMASSGAHPKAVQQQLGHSRASMTLDVYTSLFPEDLSAIAAVMDANFRGQDVGTAR